MLSPTEEIDEEYNEHFIKKYNIEEQKPYQAFKEICNHRSVNRLFVLLNLDSSRSNALGFSNKLHSLLLN